MKRTAICKRMKSMLPLVLLTMEPGDDRAFLEQAYLDYHRLMYAQALRVLRDAAAAEDAVSDALLSLTKKIPLLRTFDRNKLRAYCVITVKHAAISALRRRQREHPATEEDRLADTADEGRVEDRLLERAGVERIKAAIRRLPEQEMRIMVMRYFREMTDGEIAQETGLQPVSVRVHLSRARKRLREILAGEEAQP